MLGCGFSMSLRERYRLSYETMCALDVREKCIRKKLEVYRSVYNLHFYTLPLVVVYTSPGRWGAHYTTVIHFSRTSSARRTTHYGSIAPKVLNASQMTHMVRVRMCMLIDTQMSIKHYIDTALI